MQEYFDSCTRLVLDHVQVVVPPNLSEYRYYPEIILYVIRAKWSNITDTIQILLM